MLALSHAIESGETPLPLWSSTLPSLVSVAKLASLHENSPPQLRRGCVAERHGGGVDLLESRCWCSSSPAVRTTPAAVYGRGFPSLSKEGNFRVEFRDSFSGRAHTVW